MKITRESAPINEVANKSAIPGLVRDTVVFTGLYYLIPKIPLISNFLKKRYLVLPLAHKATTGCTYAMEKIANYAFPNHSSAMKKSGSIIIASLAVWQGAELLGHPLGYFFLLSPIIQYYNFITQLDTEAASLQQRALIASARA